jgi:hypothetical protein
MQNTLVQDWNHLKSLFHVTIPVLIGKEFSLLGRNAVWSVAKCVTVFYSDYIWSRIWEFGGQILLRSFIYFVGVHNQCGIFQGCSYGCILGYLYYFHCALYVSVRGSLLWHVCRVINKKHYLTHNMTLRYNISKHTLFTAYVDYVLLKRRHISIFKTIIGRGGGCILIQERITNRIYKTK